MRGNNNFDAAAAEAEAREARRKAAERMEEGLCGRCGERPINPQVSKKLCFDCWEDQPIHNCMVNGCPNSVDGSYRQGEFCSIHLSKTVHEALEDWNENMERAEELKQEYERLKARADFDPESDTVHPQKKTEEQQEVEDKRLQYLMAKREADHIRGEIDQAMNCNEDLFHDNFEPFER